MPLAWYLDVLTLTQLYVVALFTGVLTVFFDVAYQSYLPSLVGRDYLVEGNAKLEASRAVAQIAGPSIGGGAGPVADGAVRAARRRGVLPVVGGMDRRHLDAGGAAGTRAGPAPGAGDPGRV